MSAYIVEERVIAELAKVYANRLYMGFDASRRDNAARTLAEENIRSIRYRYPDADEMEMVPEGFVEACVELATIESKISYSPVELLKAADCLDYQSCETPDWESTRACEILNEIRLILIKRLPGYEEAAWGLREA